MTDRFVSLQGSGAIDAYRSNRGAFVAQTTGDLLDEYPLGAGVGRWGMMNTYLANQDEYRAAPIYVEIQLTGWLLDGGVLMWLLYGGAILLSMWVAFTLTSSRNPILAEVAIVALGVNAYIMVLVMGSPVFNTQMGILFWTLTGALHGASRAADQHVRSGAAVPVTASAGSEGHQWHIITCDLPASVGGVSDYAFTLASGLGSTSDVHVWCPPGQSAAPAIERVTVHGTPDRSRDANCAG